MTWTVDIAVALQQVRPAPCDKYGRAKRQQCASKRLACSAYAHYVASAGIDAPQRRGGRG